MLKIGAVGCLLIIKGSNCVYRRLILCPESPLPPTILATFITALHFRPFQPLPMLFPPVLLFSTYLNLNSYVVDSAGITAAWSGLYLLLARRRKTAGLGFTGRLTSRFGTRGLVRGATMGVAAVNLVAGGVTYAFGRRKVDDAV
jgi:hypothetical protein